MQRNTGIRVCTRVYTCVHVYAVPVPVTGTCTRVLGVLEYRYAIPYLVLLPGYCKTRRPAFASYRGTRVGWELVFTKHRHKPNTVQNHKEAKPCEHGKQRKEVVTLSTGIALGSVDSKCTRVGVSPVDQCIHPPSSIHLSLEAQVPYSHTCTRVPVTACPYSSARWFLRSHMSKKYEMVLELCSYPSSS